ncbi:MAG: L-threonylcarbamoyladenylate synthase [Alphaproteobacteria bacterium]
METRVQPFSDEAIAQAARLILAGDVVAVPTETVYGLAADATNAQAVARIYEAKGRPSFNPLIVHVFSLDDACEIAALGPLSLELARKHWPGPLTIVAPLQPGSAIASLVTAGLRTVAVRVPRHRAIRALLEASGRPLAAPSANLSGSISPTRADHVRKSLGGRIPLIIDDGACPSGIESTIVSESEGQLRLLRPGPIEIEGALRAAPGKIEAPGQLASHYAPSKPLRLNATSARDDEYLIGFGSVAGESNLSQSGDLVEAAANLFDLLHLADASKKPKIAVAPVPDNGLGRAINDRLGRAAA